MIWEPFLLALALGLVVSAGLYFAYLWPSVEPVDDEDATSGGAAPTTAEPATGTAAEPDEAAAT